MLTSCNSHSTSYLLKNGDIIFCNYQLGQLNSAIDKVTQTVNNTHYSHMGLVEIAEQDTFIIHASLKQGVSKQTLANFIASDQASLVNVYRLKNVNNELITQAIIRANTLVGLPYNLHYIMNDSCYYCSQLIYEAFKQDSVFTLEPMTFKNPDSDEFNTGWVEHYENLGIEIPESEPGCNPNGMASSTSLEFVGTLLRN